MKNEHEDVWNQMIISNRNQKSSHEFESFYIHPL